MSQIPHLAHPGASLYAKYRALSDDLHKRDAWYRRLTDNQRRSLVDYARLVWEASRPRRQA